MLSLSVGMLHGPCRALSTGKPGPSRFWQVCAAKPSIKLAKALPASVRLNVSCTISGSHAMQVEMHVVTQHQDGSLLCG